MTRRIVESDIDPDLADLVNEAFSDELATLKVEFLEAIEFFGPWMAMVVAEGRPK